MSQKMLDFDNIDEWAPSLSEILYPLMTDSARKKLAESQLEYVQDTRDLLFALTDRNKIIDNVLNWLSSNNIMGYHGTRVTDDESESIQMNGLLPLNALARRLRLVRTLSRHPRWTDLAGRLDDVIESCGPRNRDGHREGQVHLTLSMDGLIHDFNHYLIYGSEFDQRVVQRLLGEDGVKYLSLDGKSKVIRVAVPGNLALKAAHPFFSVEDVRDAEEVPNLVNEFLMAWSYSLSDPTFQSRQLMIDCGMIFWEIVPADWIKDIITIDALSDSVGDKTV